MENIKASILWLVELTNEITKALEDGKMQRAEVWALIPNAFKLPKIAAGLKHIPAEWELLKDDEQAKDELIKFVADNLDVDNDKAEQTVLSALKFGVAAGVFVEDMVKIYK